MTSKTTTKANRKTATRTARKKSHRINRQRRLQKQLQALLLERHSRRCIICHHPEREAIEEEFVHWRAPWKLAQDYKLADYRTVYRHARAAGLLLQRRERLHSALDAFVESVDDVTFTGDTILRAMRAYSCIDTHGRWTEIPTKVQFSTSTDAHPPQPPSRRSNVASDVIDIDPDQEPGDDAEEDQENAPEERVTASDVLDVIRKYANHTSRSDATACAASPAQASKVPEDEYADPENDDIDDDPGDEPEDDEDNAPEEHVTAFDVLDVVRKYANHASRSDATTCAASPAQAFNVSGDQYDELEDNDSDADDESEEDAEDDAEEDAENELEKLVTSLSTSSKSTSRSDTTACAAPPAQSPARISTCRFRHPRHRPEIFKSRIAQRCHRLRCLTRASLAARRYSRPKSE